MKDPLIDIDDSEHCKGTKKIGDYFLIGKSFTM